MPAIWRQIAGILGLTFALGTPTLAGSDAEQAKKLVQDQLKRFDLKYSGASKHYIDELKVVFNMGDDLEQTLYAAVSLARHYMSSYPLLASDYLSVAARLSEEKNQLQAMVRYYQAHALYLKGDTEQAEKIITTIIGQNLDRATYALVMELRLQMNFEAGDHQRFLRDYGQFKRRVSPRHRSDRVLFWAASTHLQRGERSQGIEQTELLAQRYPFSQEAAWALSQLLTFSRAEQSPYVFREPLLRALARNATIDDNLKEFVLSVLDTRVRGRDGRARSLSDHDKLEWYVNLRFFEEALSLAKTLKETTKPDAADHANLLLHLADMSSRADQFSEALDYYEEYLTRYPWRGDRQNVRERQAFIYTRMNRFDKAAGIFGELAGRSTRPALRWLHFWSVYRTGDFKEAQRLLDRSGYVRHIDPQDNAPALLYWRARVQERLGLASNAASYFAQVIERHPESFYAILVAGRLSAHLEGAPVLADRTGAEAMFALAGELTDGSRGRASAPELAYDSQVVSDVSMVSFGVEEMMLQRINADTRYVLNQRLKPKNTDRLAKDYPLAYTNYLNELSGNLQLDTHLVLSVMRAESRFNSDAVSVVGAQGLMQIMPYTGLRIAHLLEDPDFSVERLRQPHVNVTYAQYYLDKLLRYYHGNSFLAVAAYNAGPDAVRSWLDRCQGCDIDEFVESISFRETRRYVKGVFSNLSVYKRVYDEDFAVHNWPSIPDNLPVMDYIF